jgi:hypothetical protein
VQWPKRLVVDGNRQVSISGIKGRVTALYKVDGGYLLKRKIPGPWENDLVLVGNRGDRRVLANGVMYGDPAVSSGGDKVIVNVLAANHVAYAETRVFSLPSGKLLVRKDFGDFPPGLLGFGVNRALLMTVEPGTSDRDAAWWTPATDTVDLLRADTTLERADLTAWDWVTRPQDDGPYSVQGIPPHTSPNWEGPGQGDDDVLAWSPDDSRIVGNDQKVDVESGFASGTYLVFRASDGGVQLAIHNRTPPQATWETDSRLLLRTVVPGTQSTFQLIRCTLAGNCSRVGPRTGEVDGSIIPATRRNS